MRTRLQQHIQERLEAATKERDFYLARLRRPDVAPADRVELDREFMLRYGVVSVLEGLLEFIERAESAN